MKKILFMVAVFAGTMNANAQDTKPEDVIKVNTEKHDFGKIKQNVPVTTEFTITNLSNKPLYIENAWGTCGCTTPEIPKEPIAPSASTKLKVAYNAVALNHFEKDVHIKIAGVTQAKIVKITGTVLEPAAYDTYVKGLKGKEDKKSEDASKSKKAKTTTTKTGR
jgi:hypothetical protein